MSRPSSTRRARGEAALQLDEFGAHFRQGRDHRAPPRPFRAPRAARRRNRSAPGRARRRPPVLVVERQPSSSSARRSPDRAGRCRVRQAEMRGEPARQRALARGRRPVDGDDESAHAKSRLRARPSARESSGSWWRSWRRRPPPPLRAARPKTRSSWRCGGRDGSRPGRRRRAAPPPRRSGRRLRLAQSTPLASGPRRSRRAGRFLDAQLARPRIRVSPEAKAAATARIGYSSIIEGARAAGTSTPRARGAHAQIGDLLAALDAAVSNVDAAPISSSVVSRPERSGLVITPSTTMSEPATIRAATSGKAAEDGSAGTTTGCGRRSGRPSSGDPAAVLAIGSTFTVAPKCAQHFLGVVARGLGSR